MKKKLLVLMAVLGSAVAIGFLMPGSDADAAGCIRCGPGGMTPPAWGFGSTCQAATNDAINHTSSLIPGSCETCSVTPIGLAPCDDSCSNPHVCFDPYGEWRVTMRVIYKCEVNLCP